MGFYVTDKSKEEHNCEVKEKCYIIFNIFYKYKSERKDKNACQS